MANLNKVLLMGNLTRDVEMRFTPSGAGLASFGLAISRKFRDSKTNEMREETTFVDIDMWGKSAETAHKYLSKGKAVFIEGRLKLDQWDDKQTGQKRSKLKVVAESFQFVGAPGGAGGSGTGAGGAPRQAPAPAHTRAAPPMPEHDDMGQESGGGGGGDDLNISEDNVPF